jgi:hypothetical protein
MGFVKPTESLPMLLTQVGISGSALWLGFRVSDLNNDGYPDFYVSE